MQCWVPEARPCSSWSTHGNLLLVSLSSYGPTINGRLFADRTNYGARLRSLQVTWAVHKKALIHARDPAHDFTVKLSLSMCSHSSCLGWKNVTACDLWHLSLIAHYQVWLIQWQSCCVPMTKYNISCGLLAQARPTMINHLTSNQSLWLYTSK